MRALGLKAQGLILIGFVIMVAWFTIGSNIAELTGIHAETKEAKARIVRYEAALSRPLSENPYRHFETFVLKTDQQASTLSADIQAAIIDSIRLNQARMIGLEEGDPDMEIAGLKALVFNLSFEGDIEAILDTLGAISEQSWPLVIEAISLQAQGPANRPDRRMRVTLKLKLWTEISA